MSHLHSVDGFSCVQVGRHEWAVSVAESVCMTFLSVAVTTAWRRDVEETLHTP